MTSQFCSKHWKKTLKDWISSEWLTHCYKTTSSFSSKKKTLPAHALNDPWAFSLGNYDGSNYSIFCIFGPKNEQFEFSWISHNKKLSYAFGDLKRSIVRGIAACQSLRDNPYCFHCTTQIGRSTMLPQKLCCSAIVFARPEIFENLHGSCANTTFEHFGFLYCFLVLKCFFFNVEINLKSLFKSFYKHNQQIFWLVL